MAVPEKEMPPGPRTHVVLATESPSAKHSMAAPSKVTDGVLNEYVAVVVAVSEAVAVAAVQLAVGALE